MNLLVIIDDLLPGGSERVLLDRMKYRSPDIDVVVAVLYGPGSLAEDFVKIGIQIEFLDLGKKGYLKTFRELNRIIAEKKPQAAICIRDIAKAVFPYFLSRRIPTVLMDWGNPRINRSWKQHILEHFQARFAAGLMACTQEVADSLANHYRHQEIKVIHNCLDPQRFPESEHSATDDGFRIISVGNLRQEKQHSEQFRIIQRLKAERMNIKLEIIGEGPLRKKLEKIIRQMNLTGDIKLTGRHADVAARLKQADLFLLTSGSEGFCMALIEAMAAALPCVAYRLPVLREIDPEGDCLITVEQKDINTASSLIAELATNRKRRLEIGRKARERAIKAFSAKHNMMQLERFIRQITETKLTHSADG